MFVVRVLSSVFILVGAGLLAVGMTQYNARQDFVQRASVAHGTVTQVVPKSVRARIGFSTVYHYQVQYTTDRGERVEFVTADYHSSPEYAIGKAVPVLYEPDDPAHAAIDAFDLLWGGIGVLGILGGCFLGVGVVNLWITAVPARRIRREATLRELATAYRAGRLTRGSEYQGLLVAFTFVGFALFGCSLAVVLFASTAAKWVVGLVVLYALAQIGLSRFKRRPTKRT